MTSYSGKMRQESCVIETKNGRRNRVKVRRMKYTCRTKSAHADNTGGDEHVGSSMKILSVSCSTGGNDGVWSSYGVEETPRKTRGAYGVVSVKGGRKEMEDAVKAEVGLGVSGKFDFFGVYDGHGGADVAKACRERMHEVVAAAVEMEGVKINGNCNDDKEVDWERVIEGCFGKMDGEVSGIPGCRTTGATAVVAVVTEEVVVVGNCGDCRAVLSRGGVALALSNDHKPDREDELKRIEGAGGRVINWNGNRVLGVLATSRSIGDQYMRPYVISKPEVTVTKRTDEDEFLILASDGLWDVISNDVACRVVNKCLRRRITIHEHDDDHTGAGAGAAAAAAAGAALLGNVQSHHNSTTMYEAAAVLADLAMARGSTDNISVIVVNLTKPR